MPDNTRNETQSVSTSDDLRSRAESIILEKPLLSLDVSKLSVEELQKVVHELRVHQIELEMQNDELRETQLQLSKSKDAYIGLYEFAPMGYITVDQRGTVLQANLTASNLLGVDRAGLLGRPLYRFVFKDDSDKFFLNMRQVFEAGNERTWDIRLIKPDGSQSCALLKCSVLRDKDENVGQARIAFTDITHYRLLENELREKDKAYKTLSENIPGIVYRVHLDKTSGMEFFNSMIVPVTGFSEDELTMGAVCSIDPIILPEDKERVVELVKQALADNKPFEVDYRIRHKNGEIRHLLEYGRPIKDSTGTDSLIDGVIFDITERRRIEDRLKESEKKFREVTEFLPSPVFETDTTGRFLFVNPAASRLSGYTAEELFTKVNVVQLAVPEDSERVTIEIEKVLEGKELAVSNYTLLTKDGRKVPLLIHISPMFHDGTIDGLRGVAIDISLLKRAEEEREKLRIQLSQSQKLASLGALVGGIAHDFNNMLQIIIGYGEILMDDIKAGRADTKSLTAILQTSKEAADLVTKFLAFGQQSMVSPKPTDLNDKIMELEALILHLPGIDHLEMDLVSQPTVIKADPDELGQVIMNLAMNASEAMPSGGQLRISTTKAILGEDFCQDHFGVSPGPHILLTLTDTGRGMEEMTLSRIFDPFFSTKERGKIKGMGLGLSVVRGIVQQRGGFITGESELGKGTTFRVYFPEIQTPAAPGMPETAKCQVSRGTTVLIVEDSDLVAGLEQTVLDTAGYKTILAANGKAAVNIFKERHAEIGLVILDIMMPEMNGRDCLMELLKINPMVKVVVLTGYDPKGELSLEVKPHVTSFLPKPCKMSQLVEVIQSVMEG